MAFSSSSPSSQSLLPPPTSIVWAPLPLLSWILPLVGHVGITDSSGHIWDFAGPYQINMDNMLAGPPTRVLTFSSIERWDEGVEWGNSLFRNRFHHLLWQNCHSHVTACVNRVNPELRMNPWKIWWLMLVKGQSLGYTHHALITLLNFLFGFRGVARLRTWLGPIIVYGGLILFLCFR